MKLVNEKDCETACLEFIKEFLNALDKHQPMRELSNKEKKLLQKPWLTSGILKSISKKRSLFKQFKNDKFKNKNSTTYEQYKIYNDNINKLKRICMKDYYQNFFSENFKNSKKIWTGINTLLNRHKKKQGTIYLEDNGFISDPGKVANKFNDFFLNVADKLSAKIVNKNSSHQDYLKNPNESKFCLKETTPDEVIKIVDKLDSKKSSDYYNISPEIVKISSQVVADSLAIIFNRCIKEGRFPNTLKLAKVIPIHKGDSVLTVSNYRPISLLPIFSKIMERLIYNQFMDFIEKNNILSELQFGFQRNKSTEHAISSIFTNITNALARKKSSYCIFLDFAKAFDTVNHRILVDKLKYYGVHGKTLELFDSYLSDRTQVVEVNGHLSEKGVIKHGVPQGSILGPLLFLLYINDISESSDILKFFLFADDTTVYYSADPKDENTERILNSELEKVSCWLAANKLSLNVKKSNFLHIHYGRSEKKKLQILINETLVEETESTKYLGTFIDNKLTWKIQIQHIKSKLARGIGMISKIRYYVDEACLLKMFYSFVQSYSNYNILNWSCTTPSFLDPIVKKIKKAIRIISFAKTMYDHTEPFFKKHKILPFKEQVTYRKAIFMWKVANGFAPKILSKLFVASGNDQKKFVLPRPPNDTAKNYFVYSCVTAWNCVPDALRHATIFSAFTRNLKGHLLGEPIEENIFINNHIRNNSISQNTNNTRNNRWVRNDGHPRANNNPPFASRWDNQLRNF